MAEPERLIAAGESRADALADATIRPRRLSEYLGQQAVREQLSIYIEAARRRGEALDHVHLERAEHARLDEALRADAQGHGVASSARDMASIVAAAGASKNTPCPSGVAGPTMPRRNR